MFRPLGRFKTLGGTGVITEGSEAGLETTRSCPFPRVVRFLNF